MRRLGGRSFRYDANLSSTWRAANSTALPGDTIHARFREIGEIHAAVDRVHEVIRSLSPFYHEHGVGAVFSRPGNATTAFGGDQAALMIECQVRSPCCCSREK